MKQKFDIEIPKPIVKIEHCSDGSTTYRGEYDPIDMSRFISEMARRINADFDSEVVAELVDKFGPTPDRTCRNMAEGYERFDCSRCYREVWFDVQSMIDGNSIRHCPYCGARVLREARKIELKPCPLCGGTAELIEGAYDYDDDNRYLGYSAEVTCDRCDLTLEVRNERPSEYVGFERMWDFAIEKWNRRAN